MFGLNKKLYKIYIFHFCTPSCLTRSNSDGKMGYAGRRLPRKKGIKMFTANVELLKEITNSCFKKQEKDSEWVNSKYNVLNLLKPDFTGKVGELFLVSLLKKNNINYFYDEDKIDSDGVFDIKIEEKNLEVKTSRKGKHQAFQHENLRKNCRTDAYAFLDIYPEGNIIFSILKKEEMTWVTKNPLIGRTPHLRKGAVDQYKLDFSKNIHLKLMEKNIAIDLSLSSDQEFLNFLKIREIL